MLKASHVREYNIEVWPGYQTSIRQHEDEILLNVEITNKLIRFDIRAAVQVKAGNLFTLFLFFSPIPGLILFMISL